VILDISLAAPHGSLLLNQRIHGWKLGYIAALFGAAISQIADHLSPSLPLRDIQWRLFSGVLRIDVVTSLDKLPYALEISVSCSLVQCTVAVWILKMVSCDSEHRIIGHCCTGFVLFHNAIGVEHRYSVSVNPWSDELWDRTYVVAVPARVVCSSIVLSRGISRVVLSRISIAVTGATRVAPGHGIKDLLTRADRW
jgi:hypothetical protein